MERPDLQLMLAICDRQSLVGTAGAMDLAPSVVTKRLIDFLMGRFPDELWKIRPATSQAAPRGSPRAR